MHNYTKKKFLIYKLFSFLINCRKMSDKKIEKEIKKFLKNSKVFKQVKTFEEASAILAFFKSNISQFNIILKKEVNKEEISNNEVNNMVVVYLKHKNPHDNKNATTGFIKATTPCKRRY